jgi:RNA polymerase sigma-70 factor, ECF subfamily
MNRSDVIAVLMPERTKQIALAWSILRQSQLAEDAYQDTLAKVLENQAVFEGPKHLRDWSWKVLRHRCYELVRQQKYQPSLLDESILDLVDAELEIRDVDEFHQRADALRHCIGCLPDHCREIIRLRYFEGLRGIQVAETLGRKPEAIYKALQRIYDTLGDCIRRRLDQSGKGEAVL